MKLRGPLNEGEGNNWAPAHSAKRLKMDLCKKWFKAEVCKNQYF